MGVRSCFLCMPSKGYCLLAGESPAMVKSQKSCGLDGRG